MVVTLLTLQIPPKSILLPVPNTRVLLGIHRVFSIPGINFLLQNHMDHMIWSKYIFLTWNMMRSS